MKNTIKKRVISALSIGLKLTAVVGLSTVAMFMVASCSDEPEQPEGCQENHTQTAIDDNCGQTPYMLSA